MFHVYLLSACFYVIVRFVLPLQLSKVWRGLLAAAIAVISQYHAIQIAVFGTMFSPELPRSIVILCGWAFCAFVLLTVFTLILDILGLITWTVHPKTRGQFLTPQSRFTVLILSLLLSAYGVNQAIKVPDVNRISIELPNLPPALEGMRVVQLSDLHLSRLFDGRWMQDVVDKTNGLDADLVLITGDLIDGTPRARLYDVAPLKGLRAALGVIAIPGNHEYYFNETAWRKEFEQLGVKVLINDHFLISKSSAQLAIAGVTDEVAASYNLPGPNLERAIEGIPTTTPIILMKHRPERASAAATEGVALQLSGHTHGGMILGLNQIARYANDGFVSGQYQVGGMTLYVSNGTALWNGFPIRLGVPSEITELTLHAKSHDNLGGDQ